MAPRPLTCIKCKVVFKDRDELKAHSSSGWHKYNINKIIQGLAPLTEDQFNEVVKKSVFIQSGSKAIMKYECKPCKLKFLSEGSRLSHIRSKKHAAGKIKALVELRQQKKKEREHAKEQGQEVESEEDDPEMQGARVCNYCPGKQDKLATFASEKDYLKHCATKSHKDRCRNMRIEYRRRNHLDLLDQQGGALAITAGEERLAITAPEQRLAITNESQDEDMDEDEKMEEDNDEWEDVSNDGEEDEEWSDVQSDDDDIADSKDCEDGVAIPPTDCIFCGKKFQTIDNSVGHMERVHQLQIPHKKAANMPALITYLGEKVGKDMQCIVDGCDRQFHGVGDVRNHMRMKPHTEVLVGGSDYDQFFSVDIICQDLAHLPLQVGADNDGLGAIILPDGKLLMHRDLKPYFKRRYNEARELKRLKQGNKPRNALAYMGKGIVGKSEAENKKMKKLQLKTKHVLTKIHNRRDVRRQVKANRLQPHLRPQILYAG